jgi:hypothetical protein
MAGTSPATTKERTIERLPERLGAFPVISQPTCLRYAGLILDSLIGLM